MNARLLAVDEGGRQALLAHMWADVYLVHAADPIGGLDAAADAGSCVAWRRLLGGRGWATTF